jgi:hypothetical protein
MMGPISFIKYLIHVFGIFNKRKLSGAHSSAVNLGNWNKMRTKSFWGAVGLPTSAKQRITLCALSILALGSLSGCATDNAPPKPKVDPLIVGLTEDANHVTASFKAMADAQVKYSPPVTFTDRGRYGPDGALQPDSARIQRDTYTPPAPAMAPVPAPMPVVAPPPPAATYRGGPLTMPAVYEPPPAPALPRQELVSTTVVQPIVLAASGVITNPPATIPSGLETRYTINGTGDISELVQNICGATGWARGADSGTRVRPVRVSLLMTDQPAFEVLHSAAALTQNQADIIIDVDRRTIALHYSMKP